MTIITAIAEGFAGGLAVALPAALVYLIMTRRQIRQIKRYQRRDHGD